MNRTISTLYKIADFFKVNLKGVCSFNRKKWFFSAFRDEILKSLFLISYQKVSALELLHGYIAQVDICTVVMYVYEYVPWVHRYAPISTIS
jgi:hypothetical protein